MPDTCQHLNDMARWMGTLDLAPVEDVEEP